MKPSKSRVRRPREERKGKGGRRNWLTGGKENERVAALPKEVEKEKTSNREPRTRDTRSLSLSLSSSGERNSIVSSSKKENDFEKNSIRFLYTDDFKKKRRKELVEERNGGEEENAHFLFPSFRKKRYMFDSKNIPHLPSLSERNRDTTRINRV